MLTQLRTWRATREISGAAVKASGKSGDDRRRSAGAELDKQQHNDDGSEDG
jgi:hypothetical protein